MKSVLIFMAIIVSSGAVIDRLMLKRQKSRLYTALIRFWYFISSAGPADWYMASVRIAKTTLGFQDERIRIWALIARVTLFSLATTTLANVVGQILDVNVGLRVELNQPIARVNVYLINYLFDIMSFMLGAVALVILSKAKGLKALVAILGQAIIAFILSSICFGLLVSFNLTGLESYSTKNLKDKGAIEAHRDDVVALINNQNVRSEVEMWWGGHMAYDSLLSYKWETNAEVIPVVENSFQAMIDFLKNGRTKIPSSKWIEVSEIGSSANQVLLRKELPLQQAVGYYYGLLALTNATPWLIFALIFVFLLLASSIQRIMRKPLAMLIEMLTGDDPDLKQEEFIPFTKLSLLVGIIYAALELAFS